MSKYSGNKTWEDYVYIIETQDRIEYESGGIDSLPHVDIQNRFSYLKKNKSTLIIGDGYPDDDFGIALDANSNQNTYYFNKLDGGFYRIVYENDSFKEWVAINSEIDGFNVPGIWFVDSNQIQKILMDYDDSTGENNLQIIDANGKLKDLKIGTLYFNTATSVIKTQLQSSDNEFLLRSGDTEPQENPIGYYEVNSYFTDEESNNIQNKKSFSWNESFNAWDFGNSNVDLVNAETDFSTFLQDFLINTQSTFDEVFNSGKIFDDQLTINGNKIRIIMIKPLDDGAPYILKNQIKFTGGNYKIIMIPGSIIKVDILQTGEDSVLKIDSPTGGIENLDLQLRINANNVPMTNIFDIEGLANSKLEIDIKKADCTNIIFGGNNQTLRINLTNENLPIETGGVAFSNAMTSVQNCFLSGNIFAGYSQTFLSCENMSANCNINGEPTIIQDDFNF